MNRLIHLPSPVLRALAVLATLLLVGAAWAQAADPVVQVRYDAQLGHVLTDAEGMTLYVFSNDEPGTSNCTGGCAEAWPPLTVEGDSVPVAPLAIPGEFGTTERDDGSLQVTYNGWPLYGWQNDGAPGDTTGQAVNDVWWVANLNPVVRVAEHPEHGPILVGPTGMTLYLLTNDEMGTSNCTGGCATNWPPLVGGFDVEAGMLPLTGDGASGELGLIERMDGGMQVTYDGTPLYYWIRDAAPGDATGQNVGDVWFVVEP
jgi:predicted lipoprotein with Yx(FWY)xxD motif